ncbi:helix-turn-helix transcriptional regulator [Streptacidiphilus jiangxiensis]|uniref:Helix-turn-helix domain-containing protein n=1 Tax=Streptacidiphilus jiangxiensis TaxID=235985 RepID=A0A1H7S8B7_STRJI|nr:helix-turn-helix transcriptional regulator [Streptacidiphilus jiangxiensis]SEL68476.1 Helix-turn-helix domain-containing protein [Streptacidiphilus jiangxiensis]
MTTVATDRRAQLAEFLKTRRARVTPEQVGLAPGLRRRTPGLRREEVAQLAGVGVTWYTWLEQGRPINASEQVLQAIARTLQLDLAEQAHLLRLAGLRPAVPDSMECATQPQVQSILDALDPLPAAISSARYDILRWNASYETIFPGATLSDTYRRNSLWAAAVVPQCCSAFVNRDEELPRMVAVLRSNYVEHLGEPEWETFIADLIAVSADFATLWAQQDVALHSSRLKVFRHGSVGELRMTATNLQVLGMPTARMVVYTPNDDETRERVSFLQANPGLAVVDHVH